MKIIYIQPFFLKIQTAGADYAKIKKDLISHRDLLTSEHRILIIGNSREPFEDSVEQDELCAFFSDAQNGKALFCPHPDYATRMRLWSTYISKKVRNYQLHAAGLLSDFFASTVKYLRNLFV